MSLFPKRQVYLDWAAAAPILPGARRVFLQNLPHFGNPGALHSEAREARTILEQARTSIARMTQVKTDGVVFTSGATEANALAILGSVRARGVAGAHVLYHPSQHASVIGAIEMLKAEGVAIEELNLIDVKSQLRPETVLVTMDAVCGETGICYDTLAVSRVLDACARERSSRVLLHIDASQVPTTQSFMLAQLGADLVTLDAQKVGGVRGIGALLMRHGVKLAPLMRGGKQEHGLRPGTENPMLAAAFAEALRETEMQRELFVKQATSMRAKCIERITGEIPHVEINGGKKNAPHILNISLMGRDTDYLVMLLDKAGFAVSTKSACETNEQGSRSVFILTGSTERAASTLRISWGRTTSGNDLARFADALIASVRFLDTHTL